jgi:caffeoyl-CoA O-methyltransferase
MDIAVLRAEAPGCAIGAHFNHSGSSLQSAATVSAITDHLQHESLYGGMEAAAGVADRIELRIAPGVTTLAALPEEPTFDLAFIDADKPNYPGYFDAVVPRMRTNGVVLVDNVLWDGRVVDPAADDDENTLAIRAFNDKVARDERVEVVMLPIADGLTLCRKR